MYCLYLHPTRSVGAPVVDLFERSHRLCRTGCVQRIWDPAWALGVSEIGIMWVKQCHLHHPPVITIFIGGMFTIPRKMGGKHDIVLSTLCEKYSNLRLLKKMIMMIYYEI